MHGDAVIDAGGARVLLRGVGLGGWMNMENFITGYPANEATMRAAVGRVLGPERADYFFARLLDRFFTGEDAELLAGLGVNCVRIPINQRHFERDDAPFELLRDGFERLDGAIRACAEAGLYSVIDLHAVPGCQNQHWHSDNPTHVAAFWQHPHFQDRVVHLWQALAERYRDDASVAGYNLLNEPADPSGEVVGPVHDRLVAAVREVDPDHIVFVDGNTYSTDFSAFAEPYENTVYACHDYARPGMAFGGPYPGETQGRYIDRDALEETFLERTSFMRETGTPIWVGEFGPVYTGDPERDEQRYQVLSRPARDLRPPRRRLVAVDLQGRRAAGARPHRSGQRLHAALRRADRQEDAARDRLLGLDRRGAARALRAAPRADRERVPGLGAVPLEPALDTDDIVRHLLLAQAMVPEYAERFRGLSTRSWTRWRTRSACRSASAARGCAKCWTVTA